ncbi:LOW QUALITY PROTEIN: adenylate kinase 9 [Sminthopsis crassicaudata]|uniref:LOW QUALITY PROTEIN: adenylate kinase 9 n=1 Tax=Sminthopsis crassicaudata TaxID=9301 RepID=UPI003D68847C
MDSLKPEEEKLPFVDIFDEDEAEKNFMLSKPLCIIIFGKPGVGKTTLAQKLSQTWKCTLVEALPLLEEHIASGTELGAMLSDLLIKGQSIPDELVLRILLEKLHSLEVIHFGYVLSGLPSLSEDAVTILEQIELIKNLSLQPDIIINIKCPDYDLVQRLSGQRQHSLTGFVYMREQWDPEVIENLRKKKKDIHKDKEGKGEEEEEEAEEEEEEMFIAEMQMVAEIFRHLVQRPEDFPENIEASIHQYRDEMLHFLEDMMADHDSQFLIELDGNKSAEELHESVISRFDSLGLKRAAVITKLQSSEEEITENIENDELFRVLSAYKLIAPRYRWHRSRWGRACPVALKEGNIVMGLPDLSVSFLGKMYCLSSEEALSAFLRNPRPYLLPPMPIPPCKVFLYGPKSSGKTTLCHLIANKYKGQVFDYNKIMEPHIEEAKKIYLKKAKAEATEAAIKSVTDKLQVERMIKKSQLKDSKEEYDKFDEVKPEEKESLKKIEEEESTDEKSSEDKTSEEKNIDEQKSEQKLKEESSEKEATSSGSFKEAREIMDESVTKTESEPVVQDIKDEAESSDIVVTEDHPDVQEMVEESMILANEVIIELQYDQQADILEKLYKDLAEENQNRFPGAPKNGGWVMDNVPLIREFWTAISNKGILPDTIVVLGDLESQGNFLLNRLFLENKEDIIAKVLERKKKEAEEVSLLERSERRSDEPTVTFEDENRKRESEKIEGFIPEEPEPEPEREPESEPGAEPGPDQEPEAEPEPEATEMEAEANESPEPTVESEQPGMEGEEFETAAEHEAEAEAEAELAAAPDLKESLIVQEEIDPLRGILPEYPEDGYPEIPEIEPLKEEVKGFPSIWKALELLVVESPLVQIIHLDIGGKTPEDLLQQVVDAMDRPFKYIGWEMTMEDFDEETDDFQAETEAEEELEEEEEEEEEYDEDRLKEKRRHLGDTKNFCPVALKENFMLFPGPPEDGAKYREKVYYFSNFEARDKFLEKSEDFVAHEEPLKAPPLRICLIGPHGSGKSVCGRWLAEKFGIFHIQFEEFLQEKIMMKTERRVGPEYDEEIEEAVAEKQELEEIAAQANIILDNEKSKVNKELVLTDEEEAIKANLVENESLPSEILDVYLSEWWLKEPIRSVGFILDGFPRTLEEVQFMGEHGFCPDAVVALLVEEQEIIDRLISGAITKWKEKQEKRTARNTFIKEMKAKIREDQIAKRRAELIAEREKRRKAESSRDEDDLSEEEAEEEEEDNIDAILEEEFPKDEEEISEEEEEQEEEATDRIKLEMGDKFEIDITNLQVIQEELEKMLIPFISILGGRKLPIVQYLLHKKLQPLVETRESIFEKCYPIPLPLAQKMLNLTYKYPSSFGQWDPVKLYEGDAIKPLVNAANPTYPVIHRQYIYFLSNKVNRDKFMKDPIKYIRQPKPKPAVPIRIAVVGPPKSGKTTIAKKFAKEYGLLRLSVGDAMRMVLNNYPETELALMLNWHLYKGLTAPDELAIQALEIALMDTVCNTAGVVIDGYPVTKQQVNLLESRSIIPVIIFELDVPAKEIFKRSLLDIQTSESSFPYPLHDSSQILSVKISCLNKHRAIIKEFYEEEHQNWYYIDGFHSKWWVWNEVLKNVQLMNKRIQLYLERIRAGKAASINKLCITPQELNSRLGEFGEYCPVSLAEKGELIDCSISNSLEFSAEFRGHYYKMASKVELDKFLENPELYVPPLAPNPLPPQELLPKRLTVPEVKNRFPKSAELQGYCPITYLDGKQRYEALIPGKIEYALEYRDCIYFCENEDKLQKFLRLPEKYWNQKLPNKLPPIKHPISLTSLPLPGYLEQGAAASLIKAMNEVGCLKPKFPFQSVKRSALLYVAFHLKAFNPKGSEYSRKKYKKKLEQFIERCELIPYLGSKMTKKYKEPQFRPIDFDHKLQTFFSLKNVNPITG